MIASRKNCILVSDRLLVMGSKGRKGRKGPKGSFNIPRTRTMGIKLSRTPNKALGGDQTIAQKGTVPGARSV